MQASSTTAISNRPNRVANPASSPVGNTRPRPRPTRAAHAEGVNTPTALGALTAAGITRPVLAADLGVHPATITRWTAGKHQPNPRNLTALRTLVDDLLRGTLAGTTLADERQTLLLQRAKRALTSEAQRAELAQLADSIRLSLQAAADGQLHVQADTDGRLWWQDEDWTEEIHTLTSDGLLDESLRPTVDGSAWLAEMTA